MKLHPLFTACVALLALSPGLATAQTTAVPNFISYQGRVVDAAGANVGTGTPVNRTVIFRIWDSPSSTNTANLIYSEAQTVTVSDGEFSVLVGQGVANPTATFGYSEADRKLADLGTAFNGSARYLGVTVAAAATIALTDNEITPRQQIVSTAFAMRAKFAESIGSSSDLALTPLSGTASNYGLGWYGTGRLFGGTAVDGPVLYGNAGGALGSNASGTRNTALRWDANGRVGIGATSISSATNKLTLQGDMATTPADQLTIRGNADNNKRLLLGYDTTANKASLQSYTALATAGPLLLNPNGGNIGVNNTSPSVALDVTGAINASGAVTGGSIVSSGNIGIGTTAPATRFHLDDGLNTGTYASALISRPTNGHTGSHMAFMRSGVQVVGLGYAPTSNTFGFGQGVSGVAFSPGYLAIDQNSGNVGIGTTSPGFPLNLSNAMGDKIALWGNSGNSYGFGIQNNLMQIHSDTSVGDIAFGYGSSAAMTETMRIKGNGNVGIGTKTPGTKLQIDDGASDSAKYGSVQINRPATGHTAAHMSFVRVGHVATGLGYGQSSNIFGFGPATTGAFTPTWLGIDNSGVVQIGTGTATAKLNIGTKAASYDRIGVLYTDGASGNNNYEANVPLSIWADGYIAASIFHVVSDSRIKTILHPTDSAKDLQTLMAIQVTDYQFKDTVINGKRPQKKLIAQQVEKFYPEAINTTKGVVPDIYKNAAVKQGWVMLATDLKVGERVRLVSRGGESVEEVLEVRGDAFRTSLKSAEEKTFVYGREVSDFRSVDYDAISMLNVSATQQLKREKDAEIQELASQLKSVQDENAALRRELAAKDESFEGRLIALERKISKEGATETVSLSTAKTAE
jgi:hypothetical protein